MAKKGKGKEKSKKKNALPEPEPVEPLKEIKRFAEVYQTRCTTYGVLPLESILEQIKKWKAPNDDGDVVLSPQFACSDPSMDALHAKALAETLREFDGLCQCGCGSPWDSCRTQPDPEKLKAPRWHIRQVAFYASAIGDDGCTTLASVIRTNKLRSVELINVAARAPGMQVFSNILKANGSLKTLVVDHNPLGCAGAAALVSQLRWNMGLVRLSMQYCNIGVEGARAIGECALGSPQVRVTVPASAAAARFDVLSAQGKLVELSLQGNHLGEDGVAALCAGVHVAPTGAAQGKPLVVAGKTIETPRNSCTTCARRAARPRRLPCCSDRELTDP